MSDIAKYYLEFFLLFVGSRSYLVEVHPAPKDPPYRNDLIDLPQWVFHSKLVIWLSGNQAPIYERSLAGEEIKQMFIAARKKVSAVG